MRAAATARAATAMRAARAATAAARAATAMRAARGTALIMKTILLTKTTRRVGAVAVVVGGRDVATMTGAFLNVFQRLHLPALLDVVVPVVQKL